MSDALVLVGSRTEFRAKLTTALTPRTPLAVREAFEREKGALWLASRADRLMALVGLPARAAHDQRLLLLRPPAPGDSEFLRVLFRIVIEPDDVRLLSTDELLDVLGSSERDDRFIGGSVGTESVVLYRGSLRPVVIPKSWFKPRSKGPKPHFDAFDVIDSGQTIRLGEYEAAADAILYEFDADYRRRAKERRINDDITFGGSLRRLRLQRRLARSDFPGVTAKEIARIERGEVVGPHAATLSLIAHRLGVSPAELETY